MTGRLGSAGLVGLVSAVVVMAVGAEVYGFEVIWTAVPAVLVTLTAGMFCFCALGLAVTVLVPAADSALPVAWGTILPLCFISDVFMPLEDAPHWVRTAASLFPLRPFADELERQFNPVTGSAALNWHHIEIIIAWGIAAAAFALIAFRWEPGSRGHRHGRAQAAAGFATGRVRGLLDRSAQATQIKPRPLPQAAPRQARPAAAATPAAKPTDVEQIEGPAPAEDSSVPADGPG
jgi:hypothetical protein